MSIGPCSACDDTSCIQVGCRLTRELANPGVRPVDPDALMQAMVEAMVRAERETPTPPEPMTAEQYMRFLLEAALAVRGYP